MTKELFKRWIIEQLMKRAAFNKPKKDFIIFASTAKKKKIKNRPQPSIIVDDLIGEPNSLQKALLKDWCDRGVEAHIVHMRSTEMHPDWEFKK
jgi:hypothetical protein